MLNCERAKKLPLGRSAWLSQRAANINHVGARFSFAVQCAAFVDPVRLARARARHGANFQPQCPVFNEAPRLQAMITCDKCRMENIDDAQYCDECGTPLDRRPRPSIAPVVAISEAGANRPGVGSWSAATSAVPVNQPAPHATLTIQRGHSAGKAFTLADDESYIGRWDADSGIFPDVDLDADDPEAKVSRRHARITRRGAQYYVEDLGSTNGTFINRGRRLLTGDRQPLKDGDEIIIGKTFLKFKVLAK